jgi:hypothetical protein
MHLTDHDIGRIVEILETRLKDERLPSAITKLAYAVELQTRVIELLVEGMKPGVEAKILGVSVHTVSRRRKARRMERLMS